MTVSVGLVQAGVLLYFIFGEAPSLAITPRVDLAPHERLRLQVRPSPASRASHVARRRSIGGRMPSTLPHIYRRKSALHLIG